MIDLRGYRRPLLAVYTLALLGVTLAPMPGPAYPPTGLDKLAHVVLFAGLAFLLYWNLGPARYRVVRAFTLTVVLAGLIEAAQSPLAFRHGDLGDLAAGALGAGLGIASFTALFGKRRTREAED